MGWEQAGFWNAGRCRHGSYLSGQRHYLAEMSTEGRIRCQASKEGEEPKQGHSTGVGFPGTGLRYKVFEAVGVVPWGDQLAAQGWDATLV